MKSSFILIFLSFSVIISHAQVSFTKITDPNNAISNHTPVNAYTGASWIDYNGDGLIDLFTNSNFLYRNDSNGNFSLITSIGINASGGLGNGNSWGDFDNDGDPDLARTTSLSVILENRDSIFVNDTSGRMGDLIFRGWSTAWADYDNDGFLDLVMVHPQGFLGSPQKNILLHNNGDGRFTRIYNDVTQDFSAYTGCSWYDFDMDGDLDLFIGSGEVSNLSEDDIFINMLTETGTADLVRLDTGVLATDLRDGQNWNWIDYDNDGDLDGFVTNYFGSKTNDFYRNDGNGNYHKLSSAEIGNIVSQNGAGLTNLWGDFDNDGDQDCFITFDGNQQDRYYQNDSAFFNEVTLPFSINGNTRGATAGDYDNDGFLDLFVSSAAVSSIGLYKNNGNSNNWIIVNLEGSISNKSAIGTRVHLKANIGGQDVWQIRDVNSQNSFCGANDLRVHFGLGDATMADSIIIYWPSGQVDLLENQSANTIYSITESIPSGFLRANFKADSIVGLDALMVNFESLSLSDPNDSIVSYQWDFNNDGIIDANGKSTSNLFVHTQSPFTVKLIVTNESGDSDTLIRQNYINVNFISGMELESENSNPIVFPNPAHQDISVKNFSGLRNIVIRDLQGKAISSIQAKENEIISLKNLSKGIYIIELQTDQKVHYERIIISD